MTEKIGANRAPTYTTAKVVVHGGIVALTASWSADFCENTGVGNAERMT